MTSLRGHILTFFALPLVFGLSRLAAAQEPSLPQVSSQPGSTPAVAPPSLDLPPDKPAAPDIGSLPLSRLLDVEPNWTGLGAFKLRLPKFGIESFIHGITELRFAGETHYNSPDLSSYSNPPGGCTGSPSCYTEPTQMHSDLLGDPPTFNGNFDLFVGASLRNTIFTEVEIIFASDGRGVNVNFAQVDLRIFRDFLFLRGGKFLVPFGGLNAYPDPVFVFKTPDLPLFYNHIVPLRWGEIGAQLYGRYSWAEGRALSYAFYVVNGLEQRDGKEGGDIGLMKDNLLDQFDGDKAVGGQLQIEPIPGFSFGASGYSGIYTQHSHRRLSMADIHLGLVYKKLTLRAEMAAAFQDTADISLNKLGAYGLLSYRIIPYLEPVLMVDWVWLDGGPVTDRTTATLGLNYYPFPLKIPSGAIRASYGASWDGNGDLAGHRFSAMLVVGY